MASREETFLDAPVTPAPVFAYRALKAVFWGEESTPEPTSKQLSNIDDDIQGAQASHNTSKTAAPLLTPGQKRKRAILAQASPTKSILRTPGVHTPRRTLLKDVNVKFKDPSKSISPNFGHKEDRLSTSEALDALENKENRSTTSSAKIPEETIRQSDGGLRPTMQGKVFENSSNPTMILSKSVLDKIAPIGQIAPLQKSNPITTTDATVFDAEAYMHATEKEMKKLIKYGQKMREYARRQDEENDRLRLLVDEMRKENDRLQQELDKNRYESGKGVLVHKDRERAQIHLRSREEADLDRVTASTIPSSNKNDRKHSLSRTKRHLHEVYIQKDIDTDSYNPNPNICGNTKPHQFSPAKKQRFSTGPMPTSASKSDNTATAAATSGKHTLPLRHPTTNPKPPLDSTLGTRLAPDRLAAARARVKKKAELRRASAETADMDTNADAVGDDVDTISKEQNRVGGSGNNTKHETSLLFDWAGL